MIVLGTRRYLFIKGKLVVKAGLKSQLLTSRKRTL